MEWLPYNFHIRKCNLHIGALLESKKSFYYYLQYSLQYCLCDCYFVGDAGYRFDNEKKFP